MLITKLKQTNSYNYLCRMIFNLKKMQKEVKFEKGNLVIGYCDNSHDISIFESSESEPLTLTFKPTVIMNSSKCSEYTNEIIHEIIKEAKIVVSENNEFYKNFEIEFNSEFSGSFSHRHTINRDLLKVSESWMFVNWKLKNRILQ